MSVHVDIFLMAGNLEALKKNKENIKMNFNIQDSRKVNNFLGVYYEWGRDADGLYAKMTMDKDVKKLV